MSERSLAFEIGTEEIPAFDLSAAVKQLEKLVPALLDERRIPHGEVSIYSSPRRLIVFVEGIPEATEEKTEIFKGPGLDDFTIGFTGDKHGVLIDDQFFRTSSKPAETMIDRLTGFFRVILVILCIDA